MLFLGRGVDLVEGVKPIQRKNGFHHAVELRAALGIGDNAPAKVLHDETEAGKLLGGDSFSDNRGWGRWRLKVQHHSSFLTFVTFIT